jgi:hypothetical protein
MAGGRGVQHSRGRQLGRRLEQARDDQGERQIAPALRRPTRQHGVERDAAGGAERGEHVAVRQRADDFHRRSGGQQFVAAQHGTELLNALRRASATGWRGFGSWSCRPRGNSLAAGWRVVSLGWGRRPHTCAIMIMERRVYQPKSIDYMTADTTNIRSFQQLQFESGQSSD